MEGKKAGPLHHPPGVSEVPARTPGSVGWNDAGDPNRWSLLGSTAGSLGFNDFAALTSGLSSAFFPSLSLLRIAAGTPLRPQGSALVSLTGTSQMREAQATGGLRITVEMLAAAEPGNSKEYYEDIVDMLNDSAKAYSINTPLRIAHFLAQIGHESHFRNLEEKGVYTARRMREVFGCKGGMKNYDPVKDDCKLGRLRDKLWSEEKTYAGNASKLLSYVYANRVNLGNGDEMSGEGYKYRGRGFIQLTGKINYSAFTKAHNAAYPDDLQDFVANPDLLVTEKKYGIEAAFFYWNNREISKGVKGINALADKDDHLAVTKAVNGGTNGLEDRKARLKRVKAILSAGSTTSVPTLP
jgi:hypothetical protein